MQVIRKCGSGDLESKISNRRGEGRNVEPVSRDFELDTVRRRVFKLVNARNGLGARTSYISTTPAVRETNIMADFDEG